MNKTFGTLKKMAFFGLCLTDHIDRGWFSSHFQAEGKTRGITNVEEESLEINAPISFGMNNHNLRSVINQCNKGN